MLKFNWALPEGMRCGQYVNTYNMHANEVAEATLKAVDTIRFYESADKMQNLALVISNSTKKNISQAKREEMLQVVTQFILYKMDYHYFRRRIVPDVLSIINTHSAISNSRKDKAVAQWKELVSMVDRLH